MSNIFKNIEEQRRWNDELMWSEGGHNGQNLLVPQKTYGTNISLMI